MVVKGKMLTVSRIKSRGHACPRAAQDAIRVCDDANALMLRIWSEPSNFEASVTNLGRRYHEASFFIDCRFFSFLTS